MSATPQIRKGSAPEVSLSNVTVHTRPIQTWKMGKPVYGDDGAVVSVLEQDERVEMVEYVVHAVTVFHRVGSYEFAIVGADGRVWLDGLEGESVFHAERKDTDRPMEMVADSIYAPKMDSFSVRVRRVGPR